MASIDTAVSILRSLEIFVPVMIATSTLFTAVITSVGLAVGRRSAAITKNNEQGINEIHVIVNSQRTEMLTRIDALKIKSDNLETSNNDLRRMIAEMSSNMSKVATIVPVIEKIVVKGA